MWFTVKKFVEDDEETYCWHHIFNSLLLAYCGTSLNNEVSTYLVMFIQDCFNQLTQMVPMVVDNDAKAASGLSRKTKAVVLNQSKYHLTGREWAVLCTARFNQLT